jgi:hypothetical protein
MYNTLTSSGPTNGNAEQAISLETALTKKALYVHCLSCDRPVPINQHNSKANPLPLLPSASAQVPPEGRAKGAFDAEYYRRERKR